MEDVELGRMKLWECRAKRWGAVPCYEGPHPPHGFYYGGPGQYEGRQYAGHCGGIPLGTLKLVREQGLLFA